MSYQDFIKSRPGYALGFFAPANSGASVGFDGFGNGTLSGSPRPSYAGTGGPGLQASFYDFAGNNSYITVDAAAAKFTTGPVTIAAWIRLPGPAEFDVITGWGKTSSSSTDADRGSHYFGVMNAGLRFGIWGNDGSSGNVIAATPNTADGAWHRVVAVWDGNSGVTGNLRLYVDGALAASDTYTGSLTLRNPGTSGWPAWIGGDVDRPTDQRMYWDGDIAQIAWFLGPGAAWGLTEAQEDYAAATAEPVTFDAAPVWTSPTAGATDVPRPLTLEWDYAAADAEEYEVQIATDEYFMDVVASGVVVGNGNRTWAPPPQSIYNRAYHARVRPRKDDGSGGTGTGPWVSVSFTTGTVHGLTLTPSSAEGVPTLSLPQAEALGYPTFAQSLYWFEVYRSADWPEFTAMPQPYFALSSTAHGDVGGIFLWGMDAPDGTGMTYRGVVWDGNDSGAAWKQTETPSLLRAPELSPPIRLSMHEVQVGTSSPTQQRTRLLATTGGADPVAATWSDLGVLEEPVPPSHHNGYATRERHGPGDYRMWLAQIGGDGRSGFATSTNDLDYTTALFDPAAGAPAGYSVAFGAANFDNNGERFVIGNSTSKQEIFAGPRAVDAGGLSGQMDVLRSTVAGPDATGERRPKSTGLLRDANGQAVMEDGAYHVYVTYETTDPDEPNRLYHYRLTPSVTASALSQAAVLWTEPQSGAPYHDAAGGHVPANTPSGTHAAAAFARLARTGLDATDQPIGTPATYPAGLPKPLSGADGSFAVVATVEVDADRSYQGVIGNGGDATGTPGWALRIRNTGVPYLWISDGTTRTLAAFNAGFTGANTSVRTDVLAGTGTHTVAFVVDAATSTVTPWVNGLKGNPVSIAGTSLTFEAARNLALGNYTTSGGTALDGRFRVGVFNRALTDDEVRFLMYDGEGGRTWDEVVAYADAPDPVHRIWMGPPTSDTVHVAARTDEVTLTARAYDPAGTLVGTVADVAPNAAGLCPFTFTGLTADTEYRVRFTTPSGREAVQEAFALTAPAPGNPVRWQTWSCADNSYSDQDGIKVFVTGTVRRPHVAVSVGDYDYWDLPDTATAADFYAAMDATYAGSWYRRYWAARVAQVWTWSDHDFGANNVDGVTGPRAAANEAYRNLCPSVTLPVADAIYQSHVVGALQVVALDTRSERVNGTNITTQAQRDWLAARASEAAAADRLLLVASDPAWDVPGVAGDQEWKGYLAERTAVWDLLKASGAVVQTVTGDEHISGDDSGVNRVFDTGGTFGVPNLHASRMNHTFGGGNGTFDSYSNNASGGWLGFATLTPAAGALDTTWGLMQAHTDPAHTRSFSQSTSSPDVTPPAAPVLDQALAFDFTP